MAKRNGQHFAFPGGRPKVPFRFEQDALRVIERNQMQDVEPYWCNKCKHYHIGHVMQKAAR